MIEMIKGYSFMNGYCVRRLLDEGVCVSDIVKCYVDVDGVISLCPLDCSVAGGRDVVFLGYSREWR